MDENYNDLIFDDVLEEQEAAAEARPEDPGQEFADRFASMARKEYPDEQPPETPEAPETDPAQEFADEFAEIARTPRDAFN